MTNVGVQYWESGKQKCMEKLTHLENTRKEYIAMKNLADSKTEQLQRAVKDIDESNLKILELTRALEISRSKNNYLKNTITSMKSKSEISEDELEKNIEISNENNQKISTIESENSTLREAIHTSQIECMELRRCIENVGIQLKNKKMMIDELKKKNISIHKSFCEIQQKFQDLEEQNEIAKNVGNIVQEMEAEIELTEIIKMKCEAVENEKFSIELEVANLKSTIETISLSINSSVNKEMLESTLPSSVLMKNWLKTRCSLSKKMSENNELIKQCITNLKEKRSENKNLIIELNKYQNDHRMHQEKNSSKEES